MPRQKDLKRLVRARMRKTGEAYTAARAQVIRKSKSTSKPPATDDYGKLAGMSDAVVTEKTGCGWERWVRALDASGAAEMSHRDVVALVHKKHKIGPWWSQMVVVGYERIKGLRARGQRRDGQYEATKSRTYNVPVATLYAAWADSRTRRGWLTEAVKVRKTTAPKSMRLDWPGGAIVAVGFFAKGAKKSNVAISHGKVPTREDAARIKAEWGERFDALKRALAEL